MGGYVPVAFALEEGGAVLMGNLPANTGWVWVERGWCEI